MKYKLITTLTTLALLGGGTIAPALAQDFDATPVAAVEAPTATEVETPAESLETSSEVPSENSEPETDQGEDTSEHPAELGSNLYDAIKAGKWLVGVGFFLLLLVALARKFGGTWAKTKTGGYVLGFGIPMLGALGLSLSTGTWSIDLFIGALTAGLAASGLHTAAKDVHKRAAGGDV